MPRAIFRGEVIAESARTVMIEGNHYFPPESLNDQFLRASTTTTWCPWKGTASYADLVVGDEVAPDAVWFYDDPRRKARKIRGHVAFAPGVTVEP